MKMLRRLLRILFRTACCILLLAVLLFVTVFIYYRMTARDPASFIPAGSGVVVRGVDLPRLDLRPLLADFPLLQAAHGRLRMLGATISTAFRAQPALFRKFSPLLGSGCQFSLEENGGALIAFDLGWKSFLFSASSFVVRTTWSDNREILFTAEEFDLAGEDTTIYRIELLRQQARLYVAIKKNILLIADGGNTIRRALTADIRRNGLAADPVWRSAAGSVSGNALAVLLPSLPRWLQELLPPGLGTLPCWTAMARAADGTASGAVVFRPDRLPAALARILRSNRYRPDAFPWQMAAARYRTRVMLYDALEELLPRPDPAGQDPADDQDWKKSGNEAGVITLPEGRLLYLNTLTATAAAALVRGSSGVDAALPRLPYPVKRAGIITRLAGLFGMGAPRFVALREKTVLAAADSKVILAILKDAEPVYPIPAPAANGILAAPAAGLLLHFSHTDGTIRFRRELMRRGR